MDKCENRRLEYLWGTFLRTLRKKKSIFLKMAVGEETLDLVLSFGEKIRREELERGFREKDSEKCSGAQVPVPECVMQKRFPAAGESRIHNALRVSGLGASERSLWTALSIAVRAGSKLPRP